jgi:ParB family chromosome partitioning protein
MTRQPTPDDILGDVSQETTDDIVATVMGKPPGEAMFDNFGSIAIFGDFQLPPAGATYPGTPIMIRLDWLKDNPYQPRQTYTGIEDLAENIRVNGLLQAPVARERQGFYQLAFGHRRLRAYRQLAAQHGGEWRSMPVIVRPLTDEEMARHAWSENHNREDVSAVEEARLFQRMIDDFGLTQQEIADDVGKSRSAVANTLRLLQLPEQAQTLIENGKITERHGRELLRLAGAPKWLKKHLDDLIDDQRNGLNEVKTVSDLKRQIDQYIKLNGVFMPEDPIVDPDRYDKKKHLPPAWGWEYAPKSPDVVGPCRKCPQLVHFGGDPAPRCTNGTCHAAKERIWTDNERERQRLAALAVVNAAAAAAPAPATGQRKPQAEPAAPRAIEKIEHQGYGVNFFRQADSTAPAALLEHGLCGKDQCECFCLARIQTYSYRDTDLDKYVRPDPVNAPEIGYACKSAQTLAARRRRLEAIVEPAKAEAENDRRAQLSKETRDTKELLREFWSETGPDGLMLSKKVLQSILVRLSPMSNDGYKGKTLAELWDKVFWSLAEYACKTADWQDSARLERWDKESAEKWIAQIRAEIDAAGRLPAAPPAHQPGPGDSQKTGWENDWDEEDEKAWRRAWLNGFFAQGNPDTIARPRVLLRAIEESTADTKLVRGALWRRYNQLTNEGDPHDPTDA